MAAAPITVSQTVARSADTEYLIRRSTSKGYQYFSLLTPPLYSIYASTRTPSIWTVSRCLRATWVGGVIGLSSAGLFEYLRVIRESNETIHGRRLRTAYDLSSLRGDDHSMIGSVLGAILTPALLWKRARSVHLFLGGAGIGAGVGLLTHWGRTILGDGPQTSGPSHTRS
ncbi:hypothetical protein BD410DRAFT_874480 [Rickenella mellea]|uniref:Uncharacterized protein n=1 Tax=Rickenella mellea TaxID=50990 RepID=A0A4Y7QJ14_9AGAM|nr:hypothetical protein BD410DRAFT_874480 [Rickenella mellea]